MLTTMEGIAEQFSREQLNAIIRLMTYQLGELVDALGQELEKLAGSTRTTISLVGNCREITSAQLVQSLNDDLFTSTIAAISVDHRSFKGFLLNELVSRVDKRIHQAQAENRTFEQTISLLTPLEILMHMRYSAKACCLRENPGLEGQALEEATNAQFTKFWGRDSEPEQKRQSGRRSKK